ncbi:MAG: extracellular solute-binding protein [Neomegalonema sp.]|nr:extracellular solute-binding protein [Neomegalonema sp.]
MRLTRRELAKMGMGLAALRAGLGAAPMAQAQSAAAPVGTGVRVHGHSLIGALRYGPDFKHFDYVNPAAPKGGTARYFAGVSYDSLNPFIVAGSPATPIAGTSSAAMAVVIETLMAAPLDEGSTHYGRLAEWMESGPDDKWVAFRLRDAARWHDGKPVTVEDVIFSYETLTTKGLPRYRAYYRNIVSARDVGDRTVLFEFDKGGNRELPHIAGQLYVFPAHWWASRDFGAPSLEAPLGSGPYKVGKFEANRFIEFERVSNYWGADLPMNVGSNNFDKIRFDYYGTSEVAFEAFKVNNLDFHAEGVARNWATKYAFPAIKSGAVVKEEIPLEGSKPVSGFFYNLRRKKFSDRRTRAALNLLLDFENMNKVIYYDQYARPYSYFQGSKDLMATGLPSADELALLEPLKDQLPPELFTESFAHPTTNGRGRIPRKTLRKARSLFLAAGWRFEGGRLVDAAGAPFTIEFLTSSPALEPTIRHFMNNLKRAGVAPSIRTVDPTQYKTRADKYDFDCINWYVWNSESPGNEQRYFWGSSEASKPGGRNYCGVANPAVDALIDKIIFAADRASLAAACKALDRVLLFEHYVTLRAFSPGDRIAYWKEKVAHPAKLPSRDVGFPLVWWSPEAEEKKG